MAKMELLKLQYFGHVARGSAEGGCMTSCSERGGVHTIHKMAEKMAEGSNS